MTTEQFKSKITLELQDGFQNAALVTLVYENPGESESDVHFELKTKDDITKVFHYEAKMSKETFISISQKGRMQCYSPFRQKDSSSMFYFKNRDAVPPVPERKYLALISVPRNQNSEAIVQKIGYNMFVTNRLPNARLEIKWYNYDHEHGNLFVECPRTRKHSEGAGNSVQLVKTMEDSKMSLGNYDNDGDSFPIDQPDQKGSVIIPLDPNHSSLIGIYYLKQQSLPPADFVIRIPASGEPDDE